ncbi:MAG: hypothetical protein ACOH16_00145 [Propionibacteriaceae bacterium]
MITVQPIRYTSEPDAWKRFAETIGFRSASPTVAAWSEMDAGGILAIHEVPAGDPLDATTDVHLLADDLDGVRDAAAAVGAQVEESVLDDVGRMLTITSEGVRVTVSGGPRSTSGDPTVLPIQYVGKPAEAYRLYRALGLRPRIEAVGGVWADYMADGGGLSALHQGEPHTELAFEYAGDLDDLAGRLNLAGYAAEVVDEAYNRTLRVAGPGAEELWINGVQQDLYGYRSLS